jgi:GTP-binding protein
MDIHTVKFIKSSPDLRSCPVTGPPEYAFAGRSNVGKSSLLNMLINVKNLAKTSTTPGKTRLINHFLINNCWYLVDLPGYGFARAAKSIRDAFPAIVRDFLFQRKSLACLFILIDCRHRPLKNDLAFIEWAGTSEIPLALVFTKTDKLASEALSRNLDAYRKTLSQSWEVLPQIFTTSSSDRTGREDILAFIERTNKILFSNERD